MEHVVKQWAFCLLVGLSVIGLVAADVPADCEPQEEVFSPIAKKCILCLNPLMVPKLEPFKCPPRTYYDEVDTCSCIPCEVNNCCPGGDYMVECPTGSYQPKKGQTTCELAGLLTTTLGFKYDWNSVLNKKRDSPQQVTLTKRYMFDKCQNGRVGQSMAVLSGMILNGGDPKISIKLSAKSTGTRSTQLTVSKVAGSRIEGYAAGLVDACVPRDTVMTMAVLRAQKITASSSKSRTIVTNMKCLGTPRVFAAISELEVAGSKRRLSLSVSSNVRVSDRDLLRARVTFSTKGPGIVSGGAGVLVFCLSPGFLLDAGTVQTGLINGNDIMTRGTLNKKNGQLSITKSIKFSSRMRCNNPSIQLGLTKVDATQNVALNLELLGGTQTQTGFQMKFVLMGGTKVTLLEGAYLATCQVGGRAVLNSIKNTCARQG